MSEAYFHLKRKLEDLGYNSTLSLDSVPLVECIVADLLQTTRSLQHYMDLSKEALMQRDALMMEAEPFRSDNIKLIQENNQLHKEIMLVREENLKVSKESKRKIKVLTEDLSKKEILISKLQHDIRDLSLRGLCAETLSSRNKSRRKDGGDYYTSKVCICQESNVHHDNDLTEINKTIQSLQEKVNEYCDEITLLQNQVEQRDNEIIRLNMLLDGGRPATAVAKDFYNEQPDSKIQNLIKLVKELERANDLLKKEIENSLAKQHEAMLRALSLADKNKKLQEEVQKVDKLALKLEDDCNKRLASMLNEVNFLQTRLEGLNLKNSELEKEVSQRYSRDSSTTQKMQESLTIALKDKDSLHKEIKDLVDLNKSLQEKIMSLSEVNNNFNYRVLPEVPKDSPHLVKEELKKLFQDERKKYEMYIVNLQEKLSETINLFNKNATKEKDFNPIRNVSSDNNFMRDLHGKLCESEQKILMLKKENDELRTKVYNNEEVRKGNYSDVINQLNAENSELSKENISLSRQIAQYKSINAMTSQGDYCRKDVQKLTERTEDMAKDIDLLKKDKQEYHCRYKEAINLIDKLKRDLAYKQKEIEHLEEENCSYKMTNRTGKASADQLKEECHFLKEQIKKMQSDYIKEKTLANQIKNIQIETERSSAEIHNEVLSLQKKLSLMKDSNETLENKCKDLQSEIIKLRNDNSSLLDNIKVIDKERDKLIIDLDHKTENISVLEHKLTSRSYEVNKLENEIGDLKRKLSINKINEHKLVDYESQLSFLNGEILRLTQQFDTAIIENKQLQNSLADANGHLKLTKIELEKSKKDVDGLKQQLQHYVEEIRRIEELLSQKEAERSDMLEHFASLSVEANILENTNHSLESESASKSVQLQSYVSKIQNLEEKLIDKDHIIDNQSARIASMTCKISSLESEIKLIREEKIILEQNVSCLKQMCNNLQSNKEGNSVGDNNIGVKLYENKIKNLSCAKAKLESEKEELKENLRTSEQLLSNTRRECIELKLALQDATTETKLLQEHVTSRRKTDVEKSLLSTEQLNLPLTLEETIEELSHEDEDSDRYNLNVHKSFSNYTHSSTL